MAIDKIATESNNLISSSLPDCEIVNLNRNKKIAGLLLSCKQEYDETGVYIAPVVPVSGMINWVRCLCSVTDEKTSSLLGINGSLCVRKISDIFDTNLSEPTN